MMKRIHIRAENIPNIIRKNGSAIDAAISKVKIQDMIKKNKDQPLRAFPSFTSYEYELLSGSFPGGGGVTI